MSSLSYFVQAFTDLLKKLKLYNENNCTQEFGVVVAQWIRPRTLNREVPGSNLLAAAVVPLSRAL